jgi:hypothetical protein
MRKTGECRYFFPAIPLFTNGPKASEKASDLCCSIKPPSASGPAAGDSTS